MAIDARTTAEGHFRNQGYSGSHAKHLASLLPDEVLSQVQDLQDGQEVANAIDDGLADQKATVDLDESE